MFRKSICKFNRGENHRRRFLGISQIASNPIVQPQRGDTSLAPGERGEPQASQAEPGVIGAKGLAVRAYAAISIVIIRTATSVTVAIGLSKALSIAKACSPQHVQSFGRASLCRPFRPSAVTSTVTGAASAPAKDVPGLRPWSIMHK